MPTDHLVSRLRPLAADLAAAPAPEAARALRRCGALLQASHGECLINDGVAYCVMQLCQRSSFAGLESEIGQFLAAVPVSQKMQKTITSKLMARAFEIENGAALL